MSTTVRQEFNRVFLNSAKTEKEFGDLLTYISNNPDKIPDLEDSLNYGNDNVKATYLRNILTEPPNKRVKIDDRLNKFWRVLKDASCGEFLVLSENTRFLGKKNGPSTVFIRKCYLDLQVVVFKRNKIRITGNPGIGKTYFGYYLLYLLALQNTIVYDNANEAKLIVFDGENATKSDDIEPYLRDPNVWYIVDGKEPSDVNAKTILICSPNKSTLINILEAVYLFIRCGGISRFVLEKANDITHQNRLEEAISCIKEIIFDFIGESVIGIDEISHTIAHIYLDQGGKEPYTQVTVRFASDYLKQRVIDQYEARIREKLVAQIRAGIGSSLLDPYLNRNYKDSNAVVNLSLQNEILKFNKNSIDSIESQKYYQPKKKNFPSVDSIIASNRVFQMTISKNHPINLTGLNLLCDKLGGKSVKGFIYYYFVVPAYLYDDFKMQRFDVKNTPDWINKRVFQYALKIEL
ncbi:5151_t:CDS:2 [Funneliformis mosseae]|uniref:5151_t:CDS:1 n=1 Tax=Funneliformis mosseae TaxID=27381 RepID=A0A9N9CEQ8_FUNMO|nr:5151_t:CDS:2 [Funneliformis mosseae]